MGIRSVIDSSSEENILREKMNLEQIFLMTQSDSGQRALMAFQCYTLMRVADALEKLAEKT